MYLKGRPSPVAVEEATSPARIKRLPIAAHGECLAAEVARGVAVARARGQALQLRVALHHIVACQAPLVGLRTLFRLHDARWWRARSGQDLGKQEVK